MCFPGFKTSFPSPFKGERRVGVIVSIVIFAWDGQAWEVRESPSHYPLPSREGKNWSNSHTIAGVS